MGDFGSAVSTLLQAFSTGSAVIKRLRRRRRETKTGIDSTVKAEEDRLSKSLKTDRKDVKSVYDKCTQTRNFAAGDAESESSLASILFRLNAGFVSIIDRFLKGQSTQSDYHMLVNLSNASRLEAIQTFEQLQHRISQSSLPLERKQPSEHRRKRRKHSKKSHNSSNHSLTQSSAGKSKTSSGDPLKRTYLGPATSSGWVRTKHGKTKQTSNTSVIHTPVPSARAQEHLSLFTTAQKPPLPLPQPTIEHCPDPKSARNPHSSLAQPTVEHSPDSKPAQRLSIMSFATTSTKIGEIPEHKWARVFPSTAGGQEYSGVRPVFPIHPYEEPEKQPSRLRKIFRRDR